jgi:hypothetical protein
MQRTIFIYAINKNYDCYYIYERTKLYEYYSETLREDLQFNFWKLASWMFSTELFFANGWPIAQNAEQQSDGYNRPSSSSAHWLLFSYTAGWSRLTRWRHSLLMCSGGSESSLHFSQNPIVSCLNLNKYRLLLLQHRSLIDSHSK